MKVLLTVGLVIFAVAHAEDLSKLVPRARKVWPQRLPEEPVTKIVNGEEAEPHQFPHQVFLTIDGRSSCGGSIISETKILTAAHCCYNAKTIKVVAGAHNIKEEEETQQSITSTQIKPHEDYDPQTLANDICVITLPESLNLDGVTAAAIKLYDGEDRLVDHNATVSGWGRPSDASSTISPVLRHTSNPIIENSRCKDYFGIIKDFHICLSGKDGRSACNGDSGGPLVIFEDDTVTEIGVVSFGSAFGCSIGYPSGYIRVSHFIDWINSA